MPVSPRHGIQDASTFGLRPYVFHGLALDTQGTHAVGDCPFCGHGGKFSVEVSSGVGRCFVCGTGTEGGGGFNGLVFTRLLYQNAAAAVVGNRRAFLTGVAADRRLLSPDTAAAWGVCACPVDGRTWLLPGYGADGRLDQVYRRNLIGGKWVLQSTPGIWPEGKAHALHLPESDFDPARPNWIVCEGPWDGMALWEVYPRDGMTNIVAVPGCTTWRDEWTQAMRGKCVTLLYDSDHPREAVPGSGRVTRAGWDGMARVARRLSGVAASVRILRWGADGYDPSKPSGYDVRDAITVGGNLEDRRAALGQLLLKVEDAPREWFNPSAVMVQSNHTNSVEALPCSTWGECISAWHDAIRMRQDLSDTVAVLLAICASTQQSGNQLFLDLIGSPGSAKTTIAQGLLVSGHCIHFENMTKIVSGWKDPEDKDKDCSFLARANNKTWVTCEFDVMRSSPEYGQLMGKVRRIFDGETSTTYGNRSEDRIYTGLRTPWIRCGTQKMMDQMADHEQSALGDRFLRFIISDPENGERREIARSALRSEVSAMVDRTNNTTGSTVDPKTRRAHGLTGGYVDWLRANIEDKIVQVDVPAYVEDFCIDLAELCADMRARPSEDRRKVDAHDVKEMPTRLARQNVRLAVCLAVVLNKFSVDAEVLRIVRKVALDTAAGHSLRICQWLCSANHRSGKINQETGLMQGVLQAWTKMPLDRLDKYLTFLCNIDVLELRTHAHMGNSWVLTQRVFDLYTRIIKGG